MSDLLDLYKTSTKQHVAEARSADKQEVNFFDRQNNVQGAFRQDEKKGDPTQFTPAAQDEYDTEVAKLVPPQSYDPKFPLHEFTPTKPYYNPGKAKN